MFRISGICILVACSACSAWATYTPQYATYTTYAVDSTHHLVQTILVDGTTTGDCSYQCNCNQYGCSTCGIPNCPANHTPKINNVLNGAGGWTAGTQVSMFTYISYQTSESIAATSGQLYAGYAEGAVYCAVAAGFIFDEITQDWTGYNGNCGGSGNNNPVTVRAPPMTAECNGTTTNVATAGVGGSGASYITNISVSTSTDNSILLDLLGGPSNSLSCTNKAGGSWCYNQNFTATVPNQYTGTSGNILWNVGVFCGLKQIPDIAGTIPQKISCP